jgi:tetratricopeptide (TPR) repeat protein
MSFEDDDLDKAYKLLEATEKFCDPSRKFSLTGSPFDQLDSEEKLYRRIIVADCLLFESVLVFLKQGFTSYVKGGYILRKAWKMYGKLYTELEQHCTTPCPISLVGQTHVDSHVGTSIYDEDTTTTDNGDVGENEDVDALGTGLPGFFSGLEEAVVELEKSIDEEGGMTDKIEEEIKSDRNNVDLIIDQQISGDSSLPDVPNSPIEKLDDWDTRLRTSLYFGYGILNVIVSLIPPKLMKVANLFGFHGSRKIGLQALEYCSNSQDMKAPLARLSLLWYHTIVRPFFALDGEQEDAGADEALRLLTEAEKYYHDSAFFLYFRGKIHYLKSELDLALEAYSYAAGLSREQREIEHVCLFEKGWIHLLKLQFADALPCLIRLKTETRWSACFYAYMSGLIAGMLGDMKQAREMFLQCGKLVKRKNNNLEKFCVRRVRYDHVTILI